MRQWFRAICPVLLLCVAGAVAAGCGHEASLTRETETGGVVTFPIESEGDVLSSAGRRDALRLIANKCPNGSRIVKEGEIPKVSKSADRNWRGQMGTERIWGIQFTCGQ
ncbi:conserved exported protein of unknown function [Nitrospira japonica]|uniref:Lipoprotein n=1 Tax=Nitrospira japonica TaxID=1325564 RepID=A0A1W1I7B1_9BACT|nr:hypothetical protein [Nitrospira japonica]SLM48890.1 conserved exported protein of unknown function [Nitrospira japonica]